ncbi:radical SAM protein [Aggregicoccus sp. 17bor-14]|uniref:radical SAM protein n=1 Tax=Myxococcaceae TaxID=31 RepID=UPI00129CB2B6|nr:MULTISPECIES: radical SAM protein [Myxococcaceae]MBF5043363.1 radical SAM protein [Simulacricoccus sp. 17bor-14]MRI89121.1 radical SAM protein [Aggregicoccus sp. 17bor-14]
MPAARPHIEPRRLPSADSVVVKETYLSVQGESSHAGLLCAFVRLTGCHLRCSYCDSEFAFHGGQRRSIADVVQEVRGMNAPLVEVTGGEPLLQPGVYPLMEALLAEGLTVLLETSGAIDVRLVPPAVHKIVDMKTPSSGECDRNDLRNLTSMNGNDELKLVIGSREDYDWSRRLIEEHGLLKKPYGLLFSTVFEKLHPRELAEWIIADRLPVRFQLQLHKYVWDPVARGV